MTSLRHWVSHSIAALALFVAACSSPTELCACTYPRASVVVVGTLTDADGSPQVGALVYLAGVPTHMSSLGPLPPVQTATTDAAGTFAGRAHSWRGPGELSIRGGVVLAGTTDTIRVMAGTARFRYESEPLDTASVALRLP